MKYNVKCHLKVNDLAVYRTIAIGFELVTKEINKNLNIIENDCDTHDIVYKNT